MEKEKVRDIVGDLPIMQFDLNSLKSIDVDPEKLWVNYDDVSDSLIVFLDGSPVDYIAMFINRNFYVLVEPDTQAVIGFLFEAFELKVVPAYRTANRLWPDVRPSLVAGWSDFLKVLMLWLITTIKLHPDNYQSGLQPV